MAIPATRTALADLLTEMGQLVRSGASNYGRVEYTELDESQRGGDDSWELNVVGVFQSTLNEHGAIAVGANQDTIRLMSLQDEVQDERIRQEKLWGIQRHPDGTGGTRFTDLATVYTQLNDHGNHPEVGKKWAHILLEEVYEACSSETVDDLRKELVQVMAVCAAWVQDLDTRPKD